MLLHNEIRAKSRSGTRNRIIQKPIEALVLPEAPRYAAFKRIMDVVVAGVILVMAVPLIVVTAVLVKLTSRGPILYSQARWGRTAGLTQFTRFAPWFTSAKA